MKTKYLLMFSLFIVLASCSESAIENAASRIKSDSNASGDNKCLLDYQTKYDQLLSEADVIAATGFSKDVMETEYSKVLKNPEHHSFEYKFKNGRVSKKPGILNGLALPDVVEIKALKPFH